MSAAIKQSKRSSIVVRSDSTSPAPSMVDVTRVPFALDLIRSGLGAASLSAVRDLSIAFADGKSI